jgi:outer membrane protein insertion porin family/translocation and assembly module TamA
MVDAVTFKGARHVPNGELRSIIATEAAGKGRRWFGWDVGPLTCLDSLEVLRDATRIREEYAERGYPGTLVSASITRRGTRRAQVTFTVREGAPVLVESVALAGIPSDAADVKAFGAEIRNLPLDTVRIALLRDSVQVLVRAAGYLRALPPSGVQVTADSARRRAMVGLEFFPRETVYVGPITIAVSPAAGRAALDSGHIRSLLRVRTGDRYTNRALGASQRELYELGLYRSVRIDNGEYDSVAHRMPVRVSLVEGAPRRLRLGAGWASLDCFRTQTRYVEENFLGSGSRLELNSRLSKIGVAAPFSGLSSLCTSSIKDDPFSTHLNYYAGATLNLRRIAGAKYKPTLTLYSERRSEFGVYEQTTDIGAIASVSREIVPRLNASLQYQFMNARTIADAAVTCERFGFCRAEDLESFRLTSPIQIVAATIAKNPLLPTDDPASGYRWQLDVHQGFTRIARTTPLAFTRMLAEGALYVPVMPTVTLAMRAELGWVRAPTSLSTLLPPQERFYGGGQNSVRGFQQNVLGPGSYIVKQYVETTLPDSTKVGVAPPEVIHRLAPSGGNAIWLASMELRIRRLFPGDLLRWVVFVDAGRVWNTKDIFSSLNANARITPGVGVRLATPIGPFRIDVGYNGYEPEPGPAFFVQAGDVAAGKPGRVICVSPGTTDPLAPAAGLAGARFCPATFTPSTRGGLLPRLAFHFSIGNAF